MTAPGSDEHDEPDELDGRLLRIGRLGARSAAVVGGPLRVDEVTLRGGSPSVRSRWLAGPPGATGGPAGDPVGLVAFGERVLVLREGAMAEELGPDLRSLGWVDLAGRGRPVEPHPTVDPATGEFHLLASPGEPGAAHQVISQGALTRRTRPLEATPAPVRHLAVTGDHVVLFADGATGIAPRGTDGREPVRWIATPTVAAGEVVAAHDAADGSVVVLVAVLVRAGCAVERWVLDPVRATLRCEAMADTALDDLGPGRVVAALVREPGGRLVAVVDDVERRRSAVVVLDPTDVGRGPLVEVALPGPAVSTCAATWLPG